MPRLHVWFTGAFAASGISYLSYWHLYLPHITAQAAFEGKAEFDKQHLQGVLRRLSQLNAAVAQARARNSLSPPAPNSPTDSASVWWTNREKLNFFCELQHLRCLFFALPYLVKGFSLVTRAEASALLRTLNALEAQHCDGLYFRAESLTLFQQMKCLLSFWIYVIGFKWIPALYWRKDTPRRRRFFHDMARRITSILEIETAMTMDTDDTNETMHPSVKPNAVDEEELVEKGGQSVEGVLSSTQYVVFNATHWIEEVGFWACPNNPLLQQTLSPRMEILSSYSNVGGAGDASSPSSDSFFSAIYKRLTFSRPCAAAFPLTFDKHWRTRWANREEDYARRVEHLSHGYPPLVPISDVVSNYQDKPSHILTKRKEFSHDLKSTEDEHTAESDWRSPNTSFGYPLCSDLTSLSSFHQTTQPPLSRARTPHNNLKKDTEDAKYIGKDAGSASSRKAKDISPPPWIPIAVGGLPRLLFVDASLAKPDVRQPTTRTSVYHHLIQTQFPESSPGDPNPLERSNSTSKMPSNEKVRSDRTLCCPIGKEKATLDGIRGDLVRWQGEWCGLPCFSKVWWGRVYGGGRGSRRRGLHYHVGHPISTEELPSELIRCAKRVIESTYA
ncbi:unnamed protein product [Phytomonas sp. Hart1]|nr:unnamed protein product [Phytomonas sp. Hart1]|eukprot:CCW71909.1 unnamed protein product [Phytomonas sp. isolate Hart1]